MCLALIVVLFHDGIVARPRPGRRGPGRPGRRPRRAPRLLPRPTSVARRPTTPPRSRSPRRAPTSTRRTFQVDATRGRSPSPRPAARRRCSPTTSSCFDSLTHPALDRPIGRASDARCDRGDRSRAVARRPRRCPGGRRRLVDGPPAHADPGRWPRRSRRPRRWPRRSRICRPRPRSPPSSTTRSTSSSPASSADLIRSQPPARLLQQTDRCRRRRPTRGARDVHGPAASSACTRPVLDGTAQRLLSRLRTVQSLVAESAASDASTTAVAAAHAAHDSLDRLAAQRTQLQAKAQQARRGWRRCSREPALARLGERPRPPARAGGADRAGGSCSGGRRATPARRGRADHPADGTAPYVAAAIAAARTRLGSPYVWGATGPSTFDCSGLIQWSYAAAGLCTCRGRRATSSSSARTSRLDELAARRPAVLGHRPVSNPATIHHVAMYVGDGYMLEAPHTGAFVRLVPLRLGPEFAGAVRPGLTRPVTPRPPSLGGCIPQPGTQRRRPLPARAPARRRHPRVALARPRRGPRPPRRRPPRRPRPPPHRRGPRRRALDRARRRPPGRPGARRRRAATTTSTS